MTIQHAKLWSRCPQETKRAAESVMVGASVAWWLIWVPDPDRIHARYIITQCGPMPGTLIVATNLPNQLPDWNANQEIKL